MDAERLRHSVGFVLGVSVVLLLLVFTLFSVPVQAAHEREVLYRPLYPSYTGVDDGNLTTLFRGFVGSMGNQTTLNWSMDYRESDVIPYTNAGSGQINGPAYGIPAQGQIIEIEVTLSPSTEYDFSFDVWNETAEGQHSTVFSVISFITPSLDELWATILHPLTPHIQSLGLPVDITLAIIGIIVLMAPLLIISMLGKSGNDVYLPLILMGLSANSFLRFWPPVTIIFLGLLCGWMLVDALEGGIARPSLASSQPT